MAIGTIAIQAFIEGHHKQCVRALQMIALLADTGSKEHRERFCPNGQGDLLTNGWRVAEAMRETANNVVGSWPAEEPGRYDSEGHRDRCALIGLLVSRVLGMQDNSPAEIEEHVREMLQPKQIVILHSWHRTVFSSVWKGPDIELIVVQTNGSSESWQWTARGWREPDDADGADNWGWCEVSTREGAEKSALQFYLEKDE